MSLEEALAANTAALEANTAALLKGGSAKPATKTSSKAETSEEADAENEAAAKKAAADKKKKAAAAKKKKGPTKEELVALFSGYLAEVDGDDDAVAERRAELKKINEYYEVDRITNADPSVWAEAMGFLNQFIEGEDPFAGETDEDDDGSLV